MEIAAMDYSRKAIEAARKVAPSRKIRFEMQKVRPIRAGDAVCDVTAIFQMIEHLDDPRKLQEKICRVLKDGGVLLLSTAEKLKSFPTI
jgi:2-polyprenyl-3-methyl-5-hydroxy-6-metoxy-1,4-benzoquinol methylase